MGFILQIAGSHETIHVCLYYVTINQIAFEKKHLISLISPRSVTASLICDAIEHFACVKGPRVNAFVEHVYRVGS